MALASARTPSPDAFSERKSSSMMTIGKRNFMASSCAVKDGGKASPARRRTHRASAPPAGGNSALMGEAPVVRKERTGAELRCRDTGAPAMAVSGSATTGVTGTPRAMRAAARQAIPGHRARGPQIFGQRDAPLALVLAAAVLVRGLADLVRLEEDHLRDALVGVDLGRQRRGVRELERHVALPLRLERRHVDDDAAARIGRSCRGRS